MSKLLLSKRALIALSALLVLLLGACGEKLADKDVEDGPAKKIELTKELTSEDGAFEMKVPASWSQQDNLNDVAVLQAADRDAEAYALLIADPKKPFEGTALGKFADGQVVKFIESVTSPQFKGPKLTIVDGEEALQYEIEGEVDDVEVTYLYTFMETNDRFLKAVTWSLTDNFDDNKEVLEAVTGSIKQVKPLDEPEPSASASPEATVSPTAPPASPSPSPEPSPSP